MPARTLCAPGFSIVEPAGQTGRQSSTSGLWHQVPTSVVAWPSRCTRSCCRHRRLARRVPSRPPRRRLPRPMRNRMATTRGPTSAPALTLNPTTGTLPSREKSPSAQTAISTFAGRMVNGTKSLILGPRPPLRFGRRRRQSAVPLSRSPWEHVPPQPYPLQGPPFWRVFSRSDPSRQRGRRVSRPPT